MPVKAGYLLLAGGGGILVWSGINHKRVSDVFRNLIGGQSPKAAKDANIISGVTTQQSTGSVNSLTSSQANMLPGSSTLGSGSLPTGGFANAQAIWMGLRALGLSRAAAAGVAGNIYQESHGNPRAYSAAGGGLFGLTTGNGGNPSGGSLGQQISALYNYILQNGSIADINANSPDPVSAATYFSNHYERPGLPELQNRTAAAQWIYSQPWARLCR